MQAVCDGEGTIGTGADASLRLSDETVSRQHLELRLEDGVLALTDVGSKNGTFLGGAQVRSFVAREETYFSVGASLLRATPIPVGAGPEPVTFGAAVGQSEPMRRLFRVLRQVSLGDSTILLTGETGTGKEVLAAEIHRHSPRRDRPFVVFDCGGVSSSLIESELFGHGKGAFTGAMTERAGVIASAHGGTLFLDEVGELPLELQVKLLRFLESKTVRRVGDDVARTVDVRVVAATHRDLKQRAHEGAFRQDLYYRLAVIEAWVPPLRERLDDLPLYVRHFLAVAGRPDFELSPGLRAALATHDWPGNLRELRNVVSRVLAGGELALGTGGKAEPASDAPLPFKIAKEQMIARFTKEYFQALLTRSNGNVSQVARDAGIARPYAHELLAKLGLKP